MESSEEEVTVFWEEFSNHLVQLCSHLHQDRTDADVTIISSDGAMVKAHSFFLRQSSSVLAPLLQGQESDITLLLPGICEDDLLLLLHFLYLGSVDISHSKVEEFNTIARDLGISSLLEVISSLNYNPSQTPSLRVEPNEKINDSVSCEDLEIIEIDPKVQSIILIDKDELYENFLSEHLKTESELVDERPITDARFQKPEIMEEESKEEDTNKEVNIGSYERNEKSESNEFRIEKESTQDDIDNHDDNTEDFDDYEENDQEDYEELEIYETVDDSDKDKENFDTEMNEKETKKNKKKASGIKISECSKCDEKFKDPRRLRRHFVRNHMGRRFKCKKCDKSYFEDKNLRRHIIVEHEKIRVNCDQCDSEFTDKRALRKHVQAIHENVSIPCDLCDYVTSDPANLKRHKERVHEGVRYSCDKCDKSFSDKSYLLKHNRASHDKVRYACSECENTYTHKNSLALHVQAHHDKVKHPCTICGITYNMRRNLLLHYKRKHSYNDNVWDTKNYEI